MEKPLDADELRSELCLKNERINFLEKQIEALEIMKDNFREDRDHWRQQAQQATFLITHQQEQIKYHIDNKPLPSRTNNLSLINIAMIIIITGLLVYLIKFTNGQ